MDKKNLEEAVEEIRHIIPITSHKDGPVCVIKPKAKRGRFIDLNEYGSNKK